LQALQLERFEDAETILNADLAQNSVDVVFYSLLGKIELACDFLVRQPAIDQGNQLLLAPRTLDLCWRRGRSLDRKKLRR
jgi:hypothetical protein